MSTAPTLTRGDNRGNRGRQRRGIGIREDALTPALFARLRRRVRLLGSKRLRQTYQTTFWFDLRAPASIVEVAILEIRPLLPIGDAIAGVEWWLSRMRTTDVRVDFHRDRDERLALTHGRIVHPRLSAVLFVNRVRGGLLAVTRQSPWPGNPSCAPRKVDWELVRPRPNRLAFFPGNLTHGVLDANNQIPGGRIPGKGRLRTAVIMNFWNRRPMNVPIFSARGHYRALAIRGKARPSQNDLGDR